MKNFWHLILVVLLSACVTSSPAPAELAINQAKSVCIGKKTNAKFSEWANCYDSEVRKSFNQQGVPLSDSQDLVLLKLKTLAPKVDSGKLSEDEVMFEVKSYQNDLLAQQEMIENGRRQPLQPFVFQKPKTCTSTQQGINCW